MKITTSRTDHDLDNLQIIYRSSRPSTVDPVAAYMRCCAESEYMWSIDPTPEACARSCRPYGSYSAHIIKGHTDISLKYLGNQEGTGDLSVV